MSKSQKQWEFSDLFTAQQAKTREESPPVGKIYTVSDITSRIREVLEGQVGQVWVSGEITNLRVQGSGHIYFTVKDAATQLGCVLFKGERKVDRSILEDGRKVVLHGQVTVYEPRGQYQLRVLAVELEGVGALQAAFEKLKQKLNALGWFASERKRPLPPYPRRVGLVTSPTGAAIRDVLHVAGRRNPALTFVLAPCRVQSDGAAREIAAAVRLLNEYNDREIAAGRFGLDLVLVTRGGGSLEDLWAFNEEEVASAIYESSLPVVSAVGHEIDFTISDFVADLRAATPSAAAEIITAGVVASCEFVNSCRGYLRQLITRALEEKNNAFGVMRHRLERCHPRRRLEEGAQQVDDLVSGMQRCARHALRHGRVGWQHLADRLSRLRPRLILRERVELVSFSQERLKELAHHRLTQAQARLETLQARLKLLGPGHVLSRGYSITTEADTGKILRRVADAKPGLRLKTQLPDGEITSKIEER